MSFDILTPDQWMLYGGIACLFFGFLSVKSNGGDNFIFDGGLILIVAGVILASLGGNLLELSDIKHWLPF